jgi:hypothetical protein
MIDQKTKSECCAVIVPRLLFSQVRQRAIYVSPNRKTHKAERLYAHG